MPPPVLMTNIGDSENLIPFYLTVKIRTTITAGINNQGKVFFRFILTKNVGAFVGRAVPAVGWLIIAYDVTNIIINTFRTYNSIVKPEDRIF